LYDFQNKSVTEFAIRKPLNLKKEQRSRYEGMREVCKKEKAAVALPLFIQSRYDLAES